MVSESYRRRHSMPASARSGAYNRRGFLERAIALGLAGVSADMLLAGCNASPADTIGGIRSTGGPATISWSSENDEFGICNKLAAHFTQTNSAAITVTQAGDQLAADLLAQLKNGQKAPDVLSLDVVWIDAFVNSGVLSPLGSLWREQVHDRYLPITMQSATSASEIWTAPFRTDIGLLYYRKDLIASPPKTWDELVAMAQQVVAQNAHKDMYGYVWEETGEGLVCNFIEVLSSFGGSIVDQRGNPALDKSDATVKALKEMRSWIDMSLSPRPPLPTSEEVYAEEEARGTWAEGKAVFMRNWPYAIAMSNDVERSSAVVDKFAVAPLPSNARSCIGGWQLAINKNSPNQDAAWNFIKWMLGVDAQQYGALMGSFAVAREDTYTPPLSSYVIERDPFFGDFEAIINSGQLRPRSARYQEITQVLQENIRKVLSDLITPEAAVQTIQLDLERILAEAK